MKLYRSFTCRIEANKAKEDVIKSSLAQLADLSKYVFDLGPSRWADQKSLYAECREKFPDLNSKHLQNMIREYMPKGKRTSPKLTPIPAAIFLDNQNFTLSEVAETKYTNWWLRFKRINFPLRGKKILERMQSAGTPASVRISEKNGKIWAKISTKVEIPDKTPDPDNSTGIDVNASCLVNSDNDFYSTKRMLHVKLEHRKNKMPNRNLGNHTKDFVHKLTTRIANDLVEKRREVLVLEDLTGLRRSKSRKLRTSYKRGVNHTVNSMPYHMFRSLLEYKCSLRGIKVVTISPEYTSSTCNRCGSTETKRPARNAFVCEACGQTIHADLNAARNIRLRYTSANGPTVNPAPASV